MRTAACSVSADLCAESARIQEYFREEPFDAINEMRNIWKMRDSVPSCVEEFSIALSKTQCPLIVRALSEYAQWKAKEDERYSAKDILEAM